MRLITFLFHFPQIEQEVNTTNLSIGFMFEISSFSLFRQQVSGFLYCMQIVIGCDGLNSIVAKSLGLVTPKSFPTWVLRGFTPYPDGHSFGTFFYRIRNKHLFLGRVPVDDRLVHWFIAPMNPFKGNLNLHINKLSPHILM